MEEIERAIEALRNEWTILICLQFIQVVDLTNGVLKVIIINYPTY